MPIPQSIQVNAKTKNNRFALEVIGPSFVLSNHTAYSEPESVRTTLRQNSKALMPSLRQPPFGEWDSLTHPITLEAPGRLILIAAFTARGRSDGTALEWPNAPQRRVILGVSVLVVARHVVYHVAE